MEFTKLAKNLDRITKSKKVREAAMALVSSKKESLDFKKAYEAMELAYDRFRPLGLHFIVLRHDGKMVYSSENTIEQIKEKSEKENHGMKAEVSHAMQSFNGYKFNQYEIDKRIKFKSGIKSLLQTGYGVASRYGFESGNLENFIAKAVLGDGMRPSGTDCVCRVSQKATA
jgi:hypothetical protein